jgi:signal peptidase I
MPSLARKNSSLFRDWLPSLLLILLMLVARSTLADHYHVPSGSMENTLVPGDHVLVNKAAYGLRVPFTDHRVSTGDKPAAGDVVIFDSPENGMRLVKRVVAVGGDHVVLRKGSLWVNGKALAMPGEASVEFMGDREVHLNLRSGGGPDISGMTIPAGQLLVLGDHRGNSHDGRYFGTIPVSALYGRASAVFWRSSTGPTWQSL